MVHYYIHLHALCSVTKSEHGFLTVLHCRNVDLGFARAYETSARVSVVVLNCKRRKVKMSRGKRRRKCTEDRCEPGKVCAPDLESFRLGHTCLIPLLHPLSLPCRFKLTVPCHLPSEPAVMADDD